ncbi:hypothetical protein DOO78_26490 [Roseicella frigidaeris]|uniref:Uncharacterized protein n=1 Tax=Roseicella frigidaeris TaxID=2230885 RepID=A0A327LWA5_9PROT|nr:hypothetical protein DOO78_26490 [Roseicella frigidaeris]
MRPHSSLGYTAANQASVLRGLAVSSTAHRAGGALDLFWKGGPSLRLPRPHGVGNLGPVLMIYDAASLVRQSNSRQRLAPGAAVGNGGLGIPSIAGTLARPYAPGRPHGFRGSMKSPSGGVRNQGFPLGTRSSPPTGLPGAWPRDRLGGGWGFYR